jgi:hypothetical protein
MEQITKSIPQKSPISQRLLLRNKRPRLAAMLFQQLDIGEVKWTQNLGQQFRWDTV